MLDSVEATQEKIYTVCGVRDGIVFRFMPTSEPDMQKQCERACAAVEQKVQELKPLLQSNGTVYIEGVFLGELQRISLEQRLSAIANRAVCVRNGERKMLHSGQKTHIGTLRGGMCLRTDGDLTVVGDVHPGARLEAGGSITVLGELRGAAFAGVNGETDAVVAAYKMQAQMLCIADVQASCDTLCDRKLPQMARLHNGEIVFLNYCDKI